MEISTLQLVLIICVCIIAAVLVAKILKELLELLIKIIIGGFIIFCLYIFLSGNVFGGIDESFSSLNMEESFEEKLERISSILPINHNSKSDKESSRKNNFTARSKANQKSSENVLYVEHHHYLHFPNDDATISRSNQQTFLPTNKELLQRVIKPHTVRSLETNMHRVKPLAKKREDINCYGKVIPDGSFILVEGVYTSQENAQKKVKYWKKNGFPKAHFFWTSCYQTILQEKHYAVTLGHHSRTMDSAKRKKKKAVRKYMDLNINQKNPKIIQINN